MAVTQPQLAVFSFFLCPHLYFAPTKGHLHLSPPCYKVTGQHWPQRSCHMPAFLSHRSTRLVQTSALQAFGFGSGRPESLPSRPQMLGRSPFPRSSPLPPHHPVPLDPTKQRKEVGVAVTRRSPPQGFPLPGECPETLASTGPRPSELLAAQPREGPHCALWDVDIASSRGMSTASSSDNQQRFWASPSSSGAQCCC